MAGASLIQLVALGVQDTYLTSDPQITFFKIIYRRHTNFAIESIRQNFLSKADFGENAQCIVSRLGDLMHRIFVHVEIPSIPLFTNLNGEPDQIKKFAWVQNLGYSLIKSTTFEIDSKPIDTQYGEWMYIWSELSGRNPHLLNKLIGNVEALYDFSNGKKSMELFIPLEFYFCRNPGLSVPLIALSSSEIKITIRFRSFLEVCRIGPTSSIIINSDVCPFSPGDYIEQTYNNQTINGYVMGFDYINRKLSYIKIANQSSQLNFVPNFQIKSMENPFWTVTPVNLEQVEPTFMPYSPSLTETYLLIDYIYLDSLERKKIVQNTQEYLIEQIQYNVLPGIKNSSVKFNLILNHPSKAFYFVAQMDKLVGPNTINDRYNYTNSVNSDNPYAEGLIESAELILNGHSRFGKKDSTYFNLIEPYEHHGGDAPIGVNVYSPALRPMDHQPSSTINMSEIVNPIIQVKLSNVINADNPATLRVYTLSYNLLRVCFGMGAIGFE